MGRLLLVGRLAARDLRRRPAEAALLLLAITAATTVLTLGLVLRGVISKPYRAPARRRPGPTSSPLLFPATAARRRPRRVKALTDAPGVVAHSGPYPVVAAVLEANGRTVVAQTEGRDTAAAAVDQPKPTKGGWVRAGGVVLEAAFAEALGVSPGDRVTLAPLDVRSRDGRPSVRARGPAARSRSPASPSPPRRRPIPSRPAWPISARAMPTPAWSGSPGRMPCASPRRSNPSSRLEPQAGRPGGGPGIRREHNPPEDAPPGTSAPTRRPRSCSPGRRSVRRAPTSSRTSGAPC